MIVLKSTLDQLLAAKDAEISALKAQLQERGSHIDFVKEETARLRQECARERVRADRAVDNLLLLEDKGTVSAGKPASKGAGFSGVPDPVIDGIMSEVESAGMTRMSPKSNAEPAAV